jgi:hypothetical protein
MWGELSCYFGGDVTEHLYLNIMQNEIQKLQRNWNKVKDKKMGDISDNKRNN